MRTPHTLAAALLFCISLPAASQVVTIENLQGPAASFQADLRNFRPDNTSPAGPVKVKQLAEDAGGEVVSYRDRISNLPAYLSDFIDKYVEAGNAVLAGGTNWLNDPTKGSRFSTDYYYPLNVVEKIIDFSFPVGSGVDVIKQAALDASMPIIIENIDTLSSFLPYTMLTVNYDHPNIFWIGNTFNYGYSSGGSISFNTATGEGKYTLTLSLMLWLKRVEGNFDFRLKGNNNNNFRNTANIAAGVKLLNSSVKNILSQSTGKTRYKKLREVHDWITTHNCYNWYYYKNYGTNITGDLPWSPLSALKGTTDPEAPVCEGYSRAMKVLCDEMGIPCILMAGYAADSPSGNPAGHMWNYIQMDNGKWYALDATWDDPVNDKNHSSAISGQESHKFFLVGSNDGADSGWAFTQSHPEQWAYMFESAGSCEWTLQPGPQLTAENWTPYDPNFDGITDLNDIQLMSEKIANDEDDIDDVDGNGRISIGDLVRLINISLSE